MAIIGTLPNNIQNGQLADATPLMADLNFIVNQVNANGAPLGALTAPAGTRMTFHQATAPLGWVIDATIDNHTALYTTTGGAITSTGNGYSSFTTSGWNVDNHTLSVAEMPAHSHTDSGHLHTTAPHNHQPNDLNSFFTNGGAGNLATGGAFGTTPVTTSATVTVNAGTANLQNTGGGSGHNHTVNSTWRFVTLCVAQKS